TTQPKLKRLLEDNSTAVPRSVFRQEREGARHLAGIPGIGDFPFPKDVDVLARWFDTVARPDARILDPFLRSGTTIEVAMRLNATDAGTRHVTELAQAGGGIMEERLAPRLEDCDE